MSFSFGDVGDGVVCGGRRYREPPRGVWSIAVTWQGTERALLELAGLEETERGSSSV